MDEHEQDVLLAAAEEALPAEEVELLQALHAFTTERLAAAQACRARLLAAPKSGAELHAFLRECWEALDGLAREVNLVMHVLFPAAGLYPPFEMTRQCTFYVVRKLLHDSPATTAHPVPNLLWRETRDDARPAYRRLSFLYNLTLFLPVAPVGGRLPGTAELPPYARFLVRPQAVGGCKLEEGLEEILAWEKALVAACYHRLAVGLTETDSNHDDKTTTT